MSPETTISAQRAAFDRIHIALAAAVAGLLLWNGWMTRELLDIRSREIVSVSLASIIGGFVQSEARAATTPEQSALRTRAYIAATQAAMKSLARDGKIVLLSEAVAGESVPDYTPAVRKAVDAKVAELTDGK